MKKVLSLFTLSILINICACAPASKSEIILPLGEVPISQNDIPDAAWIDEIYKTELSWYDDLNSVLMDDVTFKIVRCDDTDFLICIVHPYPIFLPKQTTGKRKIANGSSMYQITMSLEKGRVLKNNTCDNSSFWLKITNQYTNVNYWYLFTWDDGLLGIITFRKGENLPEVPANSFTLSEGKLFALAEICESKEYDSGRVEKQN